MSKVSWIVFGSLVLLATTARTARATTITDDVTFDIPFTNGTYGGGPGPTFIGGSSGAVSGSFTITFDPTMTYTDDTVDITETSLTGITTDSAFAFDYSPTAYTADGTSYAAGELVVGGVANGAGDVELTPTIGNDFFLHILTFATSPTFEQFGYSTSSDDFFYTDTVGGLGFTAVAGAGSVGVTSAGTVVPEPSSWLFLSAGLLALAGARWRKRLRQV